MKRKDFLIFGVLLVIGFGLVGCGSSPHPFTQVLQGETEPMLAGTRWEVLYKNGSRTWINYLVFEAGGKAIEYNVVGKPESTRYSWQRVGDMLTINMYDGFCQNIGQIIDDNGVKTIVGTFKNGNGSTWEFTMTQR